MKRAAFIAFAFFIFAGNFKDLAVLRSLPIDLTLLLALVTLLCVGYELVETGSIPVKAASTAALFYLLTLSGALRAPATLYATQKVQRLLTLTALALLAPLILCKTRRELTELLWALGGVAFIVTVSGVIHPQTVATYSGAPYTGVASTTIELGRSAGFVVIVAVVAMVTHRLAWWASVPIAVLGGLALLNSGSRGPLAATIAAISICLLLSPRRTSPLSILAATLVTAGVIWFGMVNAPTYARARIESSAAGTIDSSTADRLSAFGRAAEIGSTDVLGIGWGGFESVAPIPQMLYPHDLVLEFYVEDGVVPTVVLLLWTAITWWRARSGAFDFVGLAILSILTFTTLNALVSGDVNDNRLFWVSMGMATVSGSLSSRRSLTHRHKAGAKSGVSSRTLIP